MPEWMGPILSSAEGRPWEYHVELSRQLCDETSHAMMGEVVLHSHGVPHYAFPVPINAVEALNSEFDPREAHLLLWGIEQSLMPADTGKRFEFEVVHEHGDPLISTFQDFDWADEVVHVKIGRRWIASEYGGMAEAREAAAGGLGPLGPGRDRARGTIGPRGMVARLRRGDAGRALDRALPHARKRVHVSAVAHRGPR